MILYPAIDLKDGKCVRLLRGEMEAATIFNEAPRLQAMDFEQQGFKYLHIVDLNGAVEGRPVNAHAVESILGAVNIPVQLGGGIRDLQTIEMWLTIGIRRVILGTVAVRNPRLVHEACRQFPGRVAVGIDVKKGKVAVEGWAKTDEMDALDLALKFEDVGVAAIIYTDIERDGTLEGPNIEATAQLAERISTPVLLSGGMSSIEDIRKVISQKHRGIEGIIIGKALYSGAIDPAEALSVSQAA